MYRATVDFLTKLRRPYDCGEDKAAQRSNSYDNKKIKFIDKSGDVNDDKVYYVCVTVQVFVHACDPMVGCAKRRSTMTTVIIVSVTTAGYQDNLFCLAVGYKRTTLSLLLTTQYVRLVTLG